MRVVITSSVHRWDDTRIYHKEISALNKVYDISYLAVDRGNKNFPRDIKFIALKYYHTKLWRIINLLKIYRFLIVNKSYFKIWHFHDPELLLLVPLIARLTTMKIVYDVHEDYHAQILDKNWIPKSIRGIIVRIYSKLERISLKYINLVIFTTDEIGKKYKNSLKVQIENYPFINNKLVFQREPIKIRFGYLGVMTKIRGVYQMVQAIKILADEHFYTHLDLIGAIRTEKFEGKILKYIHNRQLGKYITYYGHQDYERALELIKRCNVGIVPFLPYENHMNCLPNKLFEYMSFGLAVVASNLPNYTKIVKSSGCGLLMDPTDPRSIAKTMKIFIQKPKLISIYSKNSINAVREKYNWDVERKKLLNIYEKLS